MPSLIELAEFRRQDILAEAARYRLASQAQPIQSSASMWKEVSSRASLAVRTAARRALGSIAFVALGASGKAREQTRLTVAR